MDNAIQELVRNLPSAAAVIFTVYIMAYFEERREKRREENAKEKAKEDRAHEIVVNQMWGNNIHILVEKMNETFKLISDNLNDHEDASRERYDRMHITQDLVKLARRESKRREHEE